MRFRHWFTNGNEIVALLNQGLYVVQGFAEALVLRGDVLDALVHDHVFGDGLSLASCKLW